jgi:CHRD domain
MRSRTIRGAIVAFAGVALLVTGVLVPALSATEEAVPPAIRLARLSGPVEVPPGDPDGSGLATFIIDPTRGQVCFAIVVNDILLPATAAHIHVASAGVAGPIVIPLTAPDANGSSAGCVGGIDHQLLRAIKSHPRQYYVNVHTTDFPGGAVRGQLHRP